MKYANVTGAVRWSGGTTLLHKGMTADEGHPLVKERPDLFDDTVPGASLTAPRSAAPVVERATRAPGEVRETPKRGPNRSRKQADEQASGASE